MGSKITRALSRTDRLPRRKQNSQEVKQVIQYMSIGLSGSTIFSLGYFINGNNQQSYIRWIVFSILACYLLNRYNPTTILLLTIIFFFIGSIIVPSLLLINDFVCLAFLYTFTTMIHSYQNIPTNFSVKTGIILYIFTQILNLSKQFSISLKQQRSQNQGIDSGIQHKFIIRCMFFLQGTLCCFLVIGAYKYIKRLKFNPIFINQQIQFITHNDFLKSSILAIGYLFIGYINSQSYQFIRHRLNGGQQFLIFLITITLVIIAYQFLKRKFKQKMNEIIKFSVPIIISINFGILFISNLMQIQQNSFVMIIIILLNTLIQVIWIALTLQSIQTKRHANYAVILIILMSKVTNYLPNNLSIKILAYLYICIIGIKIYLSNKQMQVNKMNTFSQINLQESTQLISQSKQ